MKKKNKIRMIPVVKYGKFSFAVSGLFILASLAALIVFGLKPGIDFTGGSLLEVSFTGERPAQAIVLAALDKFDLGAVQAQPSGEKNLLLRFRFITEREHQEILQTLRLAFGAEKRAESANPTDPADPAGQAEDVPQVLEQRFETIGPTVSADLRERSWIVAIVVMAAIVATIWYAFRGVSRPVASWKYGIVAIIALAHDTVITMGVFAILGKLRGVQVDIPFVVALLTIIGYSVNNTIVVFDRIRENLIRHGSASFADTVNAGVNQSFARTINTSLTTLFALVAILFFGGDSIYYFSLALTIGLVVGTYSCLFIASPLLLVWESWQRRKSRSGQ